MQLVYFGMLLTVFFGAISDEMLRRSATEFCLSWCLGMVVVFAAIGKCAASRAQHRIASTRKTRTHLAEFEKQYQCILWLWVVVSPGYLALVGWGAYAKLLLPRVDNLTWTFAWWCFPCVLLMILLDAARYQLYRTNENKGMNRARYGWIVIMLPCLATCILWDASTSLSELLVGVEGTSPIVIACLLTMLMAMALPFLMIKLWSTERFGDTPKGSVAISTWVEAGGDPRSILLWKTELSIAGAMVLGWCRPFRFLILSDLLLERLDRDELRMIVLHEAAHCRRWHVWLRLLPIWAMSIPIMAIHNPVFLKQTMVALPVPNAFVIPCVVLLSLLSMCVLLAWIARWTEFDADKTSVELAGLQSEAKRAISGLRDDEPYQRSVFSRQLATRALIRALEKLTPASMSEKSTWLHPSLDRRIESLNQRYFNGRSPLVESTEDVSCLSSPL